MIRRGSSVSVAVGDRTVSFAEGDRLTAGELVAVQQAQTRSGQTIQLDGDGRAVGGILSLMDVSRNRGDISLDDVVIPRNVIAHDVLTARSQLTLSGDLTNFGTLSEVTRGRNAASLTANNISNASGAVITTVDRRGTGVVDLSLSASESFSNAGLIESSGMLEISGGQSVANSGTIEARQDLSVSANELQSSGMLSSTLGSINLNGNGEYHVSNTGGTLSAHRDVNVNYKGTSVATVYGGSVYSERVNLNSGVGTINVDVDNVTGIINSTGSAVHVKTSTDNLILGKQCLAGDPTYFNDSGSITITGDIVVGEALAIVASGDIVTTGGVTQIVARDGLGQGYEINIIAGANVTGSVADPTTSISTTPPVSGNTTGSIQFSGMSAGGGSVDFSASTNLLIDSSSTASTFVGGNVTIASFGDGVTNGNILLSATSNINASGFAGATAGDVVVVAPGAITLGGISSGLGTAIGARDITVVNSQPAISSGASITINSVGAITSGNSIVGDVSNPQAGGIAIGTVGASDLVASNNIVIAAGANISFSEPISANRVSMTSKSDIELGSSIVAPGGVAIIAGHDISTSAANVHLNTNATAGDAGSITVVAGANYSATSGSVTVSGGSLTGGLIDFTTIPITGLSAQGLVNAGGGDIHLIAFTGTDNTGFVNVSPPGLTITTTGTNGINFSGLVRIVAGQVGGVTPAIAVSDILAGASPLSGGRIELHAGEPTAATVLYGGALQSGTFLPTSFNASDISAGNLSTVFSVNIRTLRNVTTGTIDLRSNTNAGNLYVLSQGTTALTVGGSGSNSIAQILASGGASGRAGSVILNNQGSSGITLLPNGIDFTVTNGGGGNLTLDAFSGQISLPSSNLSLNAAGSGNFRGGSISLSGSSIIYAGSALNPLVLTANGSGTGSGGDVGVRLSDASTISIGSAAGDFFLQARSGLLGGNGGFVYVVASLSDLVVSGTGLDVNVAGPTGDGGRIDLLANTLQTLNLQPVLISANGLVNGGGGSISLTSNNDIVIGTSAGAFQLSATSGVFGGDGGSIGVVSGSNLTVDTSAIDFGTIGITPGEGGSIVLRAGQVSQGDLLVIGSLSAEGSPTTFAGRIELISNSSTPFLIGSDKVTTNGITGSLSVAGAFSGGQIEIRNQGGGVTQAVDLFDFGSLTIAGADSVVLNKRVGDSPNGTIFISTSGGDISSKKVITGNNLRLTNSGTGSVGAKKPIKVSANALNASAGGQVNIVNTRKASLSINSTSSSTNSSFSLRSPGNVVINSPISALTSVFVESTARDGRIILNANVLSNSVDGITSLATGSGGITRGMISSLQGFAVNLESKAGDIGIGGGPIPVDCSVLSVVTKGGVDLNLIGAQPVRVDSANSSDSFRLHSNGTLTMNTSLKNATTIDLSTIANNGDILLNESIGGKNTGSVVLSANGTGSISQASSKVAVTAGDSAGSVSFSSEAGDIGTSVLPLNVNAGTLEVNPNTGDGGSAFISSSFKGAVAVGDSNATNGSFILTTKNGVVLNDVTAEDIFISNSKGLLLTSASSSLTGTNGSLVLQSLGKKGVLIELGANSTIDTLNGSGEIAIVVGTLPPPTVTGVTPTNVTVIPDTGAIFFNDGFNAIAPGNTVQATGTNLIFSVGSAGVQAIQLDGNVAIHADPPQTSAAEQEQPTFIWSR